MFIIGKNAAKYVKFFFLEPLDFVSLRADKYLPRR